MAYLDIALGLPGAAMVAVTTPRHDVVSRVTPLELQAIQIARTDGRWSLRTPGRIDRLMNWAFGWTVPNPLADPRLEALRRYAVMFRLRGDALPAGETDRLLGIGFGREALAEIRRMIRPAGLAA